MIAKILRQMSASSGKALIVAAPIPASHCIKFGLLSNMSIDACYAVSVHNGHGQVWFGNPLNHIAGRLLPGLHWTELDINLDVRAAIRDVSSLNWCR